jgi:TonB family protein
MNKLSLASVLVLGSVLATACASSGLGGNTLPGAPHTTPQLDLVLEDTGARPTFPARLGDAHAPALGHRLDNQILVEQGGRAETAVRLCVGADGAVADVALVRSSGLAALDAALIAEARSWRYQPLAVASATVCHQAAIGYSVR